MRIWVDDVRPAPEGYVWCKSVNETIKVIIKEEHSYYDPFNNYHPWNVIELIDLDHDAGDIVNEGGDYIKLLDWLEETGRNYPIRIHSMNPVGVANMRRIIEKNGWKEIK